MLLKKRLKIIRKFDCDFWNLIYYKLKKNRFFNYFKHSLLSKLKHSTKSYLVRFSIGKLRPIIRIASLGFGASYLAYMNPFLGDEKKKLSPKMKYKNFKKFFRYRSLRYVNYIYRKGYFKRGKFHNDLLLGMKSTYRPYRYIKRKPIIAKKIFFRQITLFYNDFDTVKLRRFGRLGRKTQCGGVNYFLFLLESRVDSIVLRLNIANKFIVREIVRSGKVLIDGKIISYSNYIVKKFSLITFKNRKYIKGLYRSLKKKIRKKKFFVQPPFYFEINYKTFMILILPKLMDPTFVPYPFMKSSSSLITGLHTVLWGW